jgi:hypothetical protein
LDPVGYELCSPEGGKGGGVRATRDFRAGETVMVGVLEGEVPRNDSHATQVSRNKWARHGGLGPKVNHSCDPNCGVELNETGACDFVARQAIADGEEITFDYAMRNYTIDHFPGGCLCGADNCRGAVTGWKDLTAERKAEYAGLVAPYLLEIDREGAMVFDFRHKNTEGKWKSTGFRKGVTREAAFASLEQKQGPMPSGRYMSRPRDGRTKNWTPFTRP